MVRPRSRAIVTCLELDLVVGADGRDPQAVLVEDQRARGNAERHAVALQRQAHIGIAARHQLALALSSAKLHPRRA